MRRPGTFRSSYDAFLSYSHAADGMLAPALQHGLHRLGKPWNRVRALRVFRDQGSLAANPDLWTTIEEALKNTRFFILLASPESARSVWVRREIAFWQAHRGPATMLIVLTGGEIVWEHNETDFDWERTTALPDILQGWFKAEPLWADLRWASSEPELSLRHGGFREAVGMLAAAVHGIPKDELDSEDVRQYAMAVRLRRLGVTALAVLLALAVAMAYNANVQRLEAEKQQRLAEDQRHLAEEQRRLATVRALQAEAQNLRDADPRTSIRLSLAALRIKPTPETQEGLLATLQRTRLAGSSVAGARKADVAGFSRDGTLLATADTGDDDHAVYLWDTSDAARPRQLAKLSGHADPVSSLAFSADHRLLVTVANAIGQERSSLTLWDLANRTRPRRVQSWTHLDDAQAAAFSPDGRTMAVVAGSAKGTLELWDVAKPSAPSRLTRPVKAFDAQTVVFSPDGRTLVTASGVITAKDDSLSPGSFTHHTGWTVWDVSDLRHPKAVAQRPLFGGTASFSPTAPVLAVTRANRLTLWDLSEPRNPRQLTALDHKEQLESVAFSPDGRFLAAGLLDNTAILRDVSDPAHPGKPIPLGLHEQPVGAIAFSPDGRTVNLADRSGAITRWLVTSRAPHRAATLPAGAFPTASAFSPDGRTFAVGGYDGKVLLWDTSDPAHPRKRSQLTGHLQRAETVSFNRDGTVLAVGSSAGSIGQKGKITLWGTSDPGAPRRLAEISPKSGVEAVAISPRGPILAVAGGELWSPTWVGLWNMADPRKPVRTTLLDPFESFGLSTPAVFGPDGTTLALPDSLWDVSNPSAPVLLPIQHGPDSSSPLDESYSYAAFRADGREMATANSSGISLWSVNRVGGPRLLSSVPAPDISALDIHPQGRLLVTGSTAGRVVLWHVSGSAPPTAMTVLTDTTAEIADVRFNRDGQTLAVTIDSGTVELWKLGAAPAIAADPTGMACTIVGSGLSQDDWEDDVPGLPYERTCP